MKLTYLFLLLAYFSAAEMYFPPINDSEWEQLSPESLNWNTEKIDELYDYLEQENSKAFLVLKDGKIVIEKYFNDFGKDSLWYWASAGKTVTAALVGIAQENGLLDINNKSSDYLGESWTSLPKEKEDLITVRHQLTMSSGLDDNVDDLDCTDPECLQYLADAGTRWSYHNAPYTLLEDVVANASNLTYNQFYFQNLRNKIGMDGAWVKGQFNNVLFTKPRSMARFGILIAANGDWSGEEIIKDKQYIFDAINTSQDLNKSYGYLWWLNGKESFMLPGLPNPINGDMLANSPKDVYNALGKNGQILSISPSNGLIVVRMGDSPSGVPVPFLLADGIWQRLNEIMSPTNSVELADDMVIYPNPVIDRLSIKDLDKPAEYKIFDMMGNISQEGITNGIIEIDLDSGIYLLKIEGDRVKKIVVN